MTDTETTHRPAERVLRAAMAEPWAITEAGLELVLSVAAREHEAPTIEALEAYRARHVPTAERLTRRGSVAILDVRGPLFRRANIFTAISGATSYDVLRRDLQAALDDPQFSSIVLSLDSPGGEVTGVGELADAIRAARDRKRIVAYVGGAAASAAYWLASAATEIVTAETGILGSIGVRAVLQDTSEADRKAGKIEFVSSQSPGKRTDLSTDEGRARVQRTVDALADVFVAAVAKGRGVSTKTVIERFGAGDVLVGAAAIKAGMADRIGSFEAVVAELASGKVPTPSTQRRTRMQLSDDARAERERIKAILTSEAAKGRLDSAMHLAFETDMDVQAAIGLLQTIPAAEPAKADPLAGLLRAKDAPGGLVTQKMFEEHQARLKVDPRTAHPSPVDDIWRRAIAAANQGAPAGAADGQVLGRTG